MTRTNARTSMPQPGVVWSYPVNPSLQLRGREYLRGHRPLLHFVHGNGFCGMAYWPMLRHLHEQYDLCLHDAQGHGDSDDGDHFPGWNLTAERIATVIQQRRKEWGDRPVVGVGHSFGGVVTLLAAAKYPQLFDAVVLLDPVLFPRFLVWGMGAADVVGLLRSHPMATRARRRRHLWLNYNETWKYFYQRGIFKGWSDEALEAYIQHAMNHHPDGTLSLKCPPWLEAEIFSSYPRQLWPSVDQLAVNTRIFYGADTYPFVGYSVNSAARRNMHITTQMMPGGHCFMQEYPQPAATEIMNYLHGLRI